MDLNAAGQKADELIAAEVTVQDKMWGAANERADAENNQMVGAALTQIMLVFQEGLGHPTEEALDISRELYPPDWDGFRSYGSTVANLVVAAAYIRSEIKRRIAAGEDTTRTKRGEPYKHASPYMSSDEAAS